MNMIIIIINIIIILLLSFILFPESNFAIGRMSHGSMHILAESYQIRSSSRITKEHY